MQDLEQRLTDLEELKARFQTLHFNHRSSHQCDLRHSVHSIAQERGRVVGAAARHLGTGGRAQEGRTGKADARQPDQVAQR